MHVANERLPIEPLQPEDPLQLGFEDMDIERQIMSPAEIVERREIIRRDTVRR